MIIFTHETDSPCMCLIQPNKHTACTTFSNSWAACADPEGGGGGGPEPPGKLQKYRVP